MQHAIMNTSEGFFNFKSNASEKAAFKPKAHSNMAHTLASVSGSCNCGGSFSTGLLPASCEAFGALRCGKGSGFSFINVSTSLRLQKPHFTKSLEQIKQRMHK